MWGFFSKSAPWMRSFWQQGHLFSIFHMEASVCSTKPRERCWKCLSLGRIPPELFTNWPSINLYAFIYNKPRYRLQVRTCQRSNRKSSVFSSMKQPFCPKCHRVKRASWRDEYGRDLPKIGCEWISDFDVESAPRGGFIFWLLATDMIMIMVNFVVWPRGPSVRS